MTRRIVLLNVFLAGLTVLACWQLRKEWLAARAREEAVLRKSIRPVPAPPAGAPQLAPPVTAAAYNEIAQKMLFSKDRNPVVIVETAPPPPPPPMPPLPLLFGVMNLGDGPIAILSERRDTPNREYKAGEQVGPFKLLAVNGQEVVLEWNGKKVVKKVDEIVHASQEPEEPARRTAAPASAAPAPAPVVQVQAGPGREIGKSMRACVPNDSTPAGAVVDGMRKVVTPSPFGDVCRWEQVR